MKYYKFIDSDKKRIKNKYRTDHYLPYWGKPGKWLPYEKRGLIFHGGYDAFKINNLCEFCGDELFEVELPGEIIEIAGTCYSRSMRFIRKLNKWNEDSLRLFAIWCAEHVLDLYELKYPGDTRPREAIRLPTALLMNMQPKRNYPQHMSLPGRQAARLTSGFPGLKLQPGQQLLLPVIRHLRFLMQNMFVFLCIMQEEGPRFVTSHLLWIIQKKRKNVLKNSLRCSE